MFSIEERNRVRERLLALAEADPTVVGAAITGSEASGNADRWSDVDLVFAVDVPVDTALDRWTERLYAELGALHHWDLPMGSIVYRVFLLPDSLEVDIAFTPAAEFGQLGPNWRTVFGQVVERPPSGPADHDNLVGLAWHHALHARACIERRRWWQAEYWIGAVRAHVIALACRRLGHPTTYAKGAHLLPAQLTASLEATLVRSLDEAELRRALASAVSALTAELDRTDPALAARLRPALAELG